MNDLIAYPRHGTPRDFRVALTYRCGNMLGGFADDLQGANDSKRSLRISLENGHIHACHELFSFLRCVENVLQVVDVLPLLLHTGTTSFRICRPIAGLRVFFSTKSTCTPRRSLRCCSRVITWMSVRGRASNSTNRSKSLRGLCSP